MFLMSPARNGRGAPDMGVCGVEGKGQALAHPRLGSISEPRPLRREPHHRPTSVPH